MIILSTREYFYEIVSESLKKRKVETYPLVQSYLVSLLEYYLLTSNLFEEKYDESGRPYPQTLAEMFMIAMQKEGASQIDLLKKLADKSLYISGFFGDSLSRKVVDIDYYAEVGGSAYDSLARLSKDDTQIQIYKTFSKRFLDFVEVLAGISQSAQIKGDESILRLYDKYLRTGSEIAKEKLLEMGVQVVPLGSKKQTKLS